jgi:hypothetical protein
MVRTGIKTDAANIHNNEITSFYRLWKRYCYTNPAAIAIGVKLRSQLETECANREEIETKRSSLNQNSAPAAEPYQKVAPHAATILSQLQARRKKSKADLAELELILEILQS